MQILLKECSISYVYKIYVKEIPASKQNYKWILKQILIKLSQWAKEGTYMLASLFTGSPYATSYNIPVNQPPVCSYLAAEIGFMFETFYIK